MSNTSTRKSGSFPLKVLENLKNVKRKILILSGKGGVGKTTFATNLSVALAKKGYMTGLLDVDIYGPNVPKLLGLEGQHPTAQNQVILPIFGPSGLKVMSMGFLLTNPDDAVAWRGNIVTKIIGQFLGDVAWEQLDYLVVDLPPGTGDEILSILHSIPEIDGVVVVTTPQDVAVLDARRAIRLVEKLDIPVLGIVENMTEFICSGCGKSHKFFGKGAAEGAAKDYDIEYLGSLPFDEGVPSRSDKGLPFVGGVQNSRILREFSGIVDRIVQLVELRP